MGINQSTHNGPAVSFSSAFGGLEVLALAAILKAPYHLLKEVLVFTQAAVVVLIAVALRSFLHAFESALYNRA